MQSDGTMYYYLAASLLGVLSHLCYFIHGEHHLQSMTYLKTALYTPFCLAICLTIFSTFDVDSSITSGFYLSMLAAEFLASVAKFLLLEICYLCSVWASMLFYRLSPSYRLALFLGPAMWRVSKMTEAWANRGLRGFEVLDRLHQ